MTKTLTALAAAATFAIVAVAAPSDAEAWHRGRGHGGAVAAGVVGGLALGAILGGAVAGPGYYDRYYGGPVPVYEVPPAACVEPQWVWSNRRGEYVWRNVRVPC